MTRRRFLEASAITTAVVAGASLLSACGSPAAGPVVGPKLGPPAQLPLAWAPTETLPFLPKVAKTVDVVTLPSDAGNSASAQANRDLRNLYTSIQGIVNRTQPRIYLLQSDEDLDARNWLADLGVTSINPANDVLALIKKYKSELRGLIVTDPDRPDTINLATALAGVERGLVVSPSLAKRIQSTNGLSDLQVLANFQGKFQDNVQVYEYALTKVFPQLSKRVIFGLAPHNSGHVRDYAVALGSMCVWLDTSIPAEKALLSRFYAAMATDPEAKDALRTHMGWFTNEHDGVSLAAEHGIEVAASDWSNNLSVLNTPVDVLTPLPAPPTTPKIQNKVYVALVGSDGDNLQRLQHAQAFQDWTSKGRGKVAINWTVSPLLKYFPVIWNYYANSPYPNDYVISGPSGAGYTYSNLLPPADLNRYTKATQRDMATLGLHYITLWDVGTVSPRVQRVYAQNCPVLRGVTDQSQSDPRTVMVDGLPKIGFKNGYAATLGQLAGAIQDEVKAFQALQSRGQAGPRFIAIQANLNHRDLNPTTFEQLQQSFGAPVEFVRMDHFFGLMSQAGAAQTGA
jgi:hypothetical protein